MLDGILERKKGVSFSSRWVNERVIFGKSFSSRSVETCMSKKTSDGFYIEGRT